MVKAASSASIETTVSTSLRSQASAYCSTSSRSFSSPSERRVSCWLAREASSRSSRGPAAARCSPMRRWSRACPRSPVPRSRGPRGGSTPPAGSPAAAAGRRRKQAPPTRAVRSGRPGRRSRPRCRASRPGRARSTPTPPGARRRRRAGRPGAHSRSAGSAWDAGRSHRARCWSRCDRARSAASCGPRTCRGPSRRGRGLPGAHPPRPAPSRACGSSGPGARSGAAQPAGRRRPRCPAWRSRAARAAPRSTLSGPGSSPLWRVDGANRRNSSPDR